ncbi:Ig-like domain-containing protein [Cesiribacter andamanensis]|uniref:Uncharacterized protein n=1 Tax=Cesiribacter andamanensis AMV16 TaxID=1279009 RepID=M7MWB3_9BACT|nr:Ig-like domain-containing protein [Cesiribacter andamanensis]EMR00723.1 hypothetical protein ADICEAN_04154 [Cesiribacter andamanensis AMV16]
MKVNLLKIKCVPLILLLMASLGGCDLEEDDFAPESFEEFTLYPDEIWCYNGNTPNEPAARLDMLRNDSIKVAVTVSFGAVRNGRLEVMGDGDTYYFPNQDFYGTDSLKYTVCSSRSCKTETARFIVERPVDPATCVTEIRDEQVETTRNQWVDVRVHANDQLCIFAYVSQSYYAPQLGTYEDVSQSGGYKNIVIRYYPPRDYVGQDSFRYRMYTSTTEYIEGTAHITIR